MTGLHDALSRRLAFLSCALAFLLLAACGGSSSGGGGGFPPAVAQPDRPILPGQSLPGVVIEVLAIRGGSGPNGNFVPGDMITVDFTVSYRDNEPLELVDLDRGAIMLSGPTFHYQRVIPSQGDLLDRAVRTGVGQYSYTFADPLPAVYAAPINDTPNLTEGEWTGQPLVDGTYTIGIELRKEYQIDNQTIRDPGNVAAHFLVGGAATVDTREVVRNENCAQCHNRITVHGENRTDVTGCVLCHTAGAEDGNDPDVEGGTPGVTIDFRVMIHKIHSGHTLPSVNGVTTNPDGTRKYDAPKKPYKVMGYRSSIHDYSEFAIPMWPSFVAPMPRDTGYGLLSGAEQDLEDTIRSAPVNCATCHEDPDGNGPAPAPAQGHLAYTQPTRAACASCHDDWDPALPYRANNQVMPAQRDDAACTNCHKESGTPLDVRDAHLHPLVDERVAPGLKFQVSSITEVNGDNDGTFDPGEKMRIAMRVTDNNGNDLDPSSLGRIEVVLKGPVVNPNLVHYSQIPVSALTGGPNFEINVPQTLALESIGNSAGSLQNFATARTPHWNMSGAATYVFLRTGTGAASALANAAKVHDNYVDLKSGEGALFSDGDYIVLEDGDAGRREFQRVRLVDGDRLWLSSHYSGSYSGTPISTTGLKMMHAANSTVHAVTLTEVPSSSYTLDPQTGVIAETTEFGAGEVLCSYTTDFVVPERYPGAFNESPDLDETAGDWVGLPLLSGTYHFGIWGDREVTYVNAYATNHATDDTDYTDAAHAKITALKFGDATSIDTIERTAGAETCNQCHVDLQFHGSHRRGYDTCLMCHGTAGSEDSPTYVWPAAKTNGVTIDFRTMIHKIHHGSHLAKADSYVVYGYRGSGHKYDHVHFPVFHGGTLDCQKCHGENNDAWKQPIERIHPQSPKQARVWKAACGSCHDANSSQAHIDVNTASNGGEACATCHGQGRALPVDVVHTIR